MTSQPKSQKRSGEKKHDARIRLLMSLIIALFCLSIFGTYSKVLYPQFYQKNLLVFLSIYVLSVVYFWLKYGAVVAIVYSVLLYGSLSFTYSIIKPYYVVTDIDTSTTLKPGDSDLAYVKFDTPYVLMQNINNTRVNQYYVYSTNCSDNSLNLLLYTNRNYYYVFEFEKVSSSSSDGILQEGDKMRIATASSTCPRRYINGFVLTEKQEEATVFTVYHALGYDKNTGYFLWEQHIVAYFEKNGAKDSLEFIVTNTRNDK